MSYDIDTIAHSYAAMEVFHGTYQELIRVATLDHHSLLCNAFQKKVAIGIC